MEKRELLYEGKAKRVWSTDDPDLVIQEFKDDASAFNAKKKGSISNKGVVNNKIASIIFGVLEKRGVETHFVKMLNDREMLVKKLDIVLLEPTMRNIVAGGMSRLLGIDEGLVLDSPVFEYHFKSDELDDPLINEYHALALKIATQEELDFIERTSFIINDILKDFFDKLNINLVDFKIEFGRHKGQILLGDEISPDTCRFWEKGTNRKLDKDRFRRDLGNIEEAYQEMLDKISSVE